jgi:hypothetical protein
MAGRRNSTAPRRTVYLNPEQIQYLQDHPEDSLAEVIRRGFAAGKPAEVPEHLQKAMKALSYVSARLADGWRLTPPDSATAEAPPSHTP